MDVSPPSASGPDPGRSPCKVTGSPGLMGTLAILLSSLALWSWVSRHGQTVQVAKPGPARTPNSRLCFGDNGFAQGFRRSWQAAGGAQPPVPHPGPYISVLCCPPQALYCSCFVPVYCGLIPPTYRGVVSAPEWGGLPGDCPGPTSGTLEKRGSECNGRAKCWKMSCFPTQNSRCRQTSGNGGGGQMDIPIWNVLCPLNPLPVAEPGKSRPSGCPILDREGSTETLELGGR